MHIFVETLNGTTSFSLEPSCSVEDLKEMIETEESVSVDAQRLIFAGKQLENDHTLAEYNIQEESVLSMTLRLIGGGKVHGSLTRAGKVKNQTPKVDKQEKGKSHVGRAKKREQYNRRYVNVVLAPGAKRVGPNNFAARQARAEAAAKKE